MARVDEHIIQGQLATRWCRQLDCSVIVVVNDKIAQNKKKTRYIRDDRPR